MSVHEMIEHPNYEYCLGDVLIILSLTFEVGNSFVAEELNDGAAHCEQEKGMAS